LVAERGLNIEKSLGIPGWMEREELEWLAFEASRHKVIVEIGSYLGRSSRALGEHVQGVVYCVDHWLGPKEFNPEDQPFPVEMLYDTFLGHTKDLRSEGRLIPIRLDSLEAAGGWGFESPDMVFIDGSHDLQSIKDDMQAWAKVIKPGGLFCGHDAHWPGVAEARRLLLPQHMTGVGSIWAVDNFKGLLC